jgi:hypothetical protein
MPFFLLEDRSPVRPAVDEADDRHGGLLYARRARPRDDRAAKKRDEFALFHRVTSRQARRS